MTLGSLALPPARFKAAASRHIAEAPAHVTEKCRFGHLVEKIVNGHLHVLYVLEEGKPTGIITLTDVIRTATYAL